MNIVTRTTTTDHVTREFVAAVEHALRRLDRLGVSRTSLLVLQNAPLVVNRDLEALPLGSATRASAVRVWMLSGDGVLERAIRVNAYPEDPRRMRDGLSPAARRIEAALSITRGRVGAVILAGARQVAPAGRVLGLPNRLGWYETASVAGLLVTAVHHPSGRNRAYNLAENRARANAALQLLLPAQASSDPMCSTDQKSFKRVAVKER